MFCNPSFRFTLVPTRRRRPSFATGSKSSLLWTTRTHHRPIFSSSTLLPLSKRSSSLLLYEGSQIRRHTTLRGWMAACGFFLVCSATTPDRNYCKNRYSINSNHRGWHSHHLASTAQCHQDNNQGMTAEESLELPPFDESVVSYDHYNGVTLYLGEYLNWVTRQSAMDRDSPTKSLNSDLSFPQQLDRALQFWKAEGRKGIWIHVPPTASQWVPDCVQAGFDFHKVLREDHDSNHPPQTNGDDNSTPPPTLVLSKWLPDTPSKLPLGPTHQVGVGVVVLNPADPSQMLCVKEQSGPAAAFDLWKMPTGLLDPCEDIPEAAVRELQEETGLHGTLQGIICFRQAHRPGSNSDLFFVCHMKLNDPEDIQWTPQEDEIADIQWMSVQEFCNQDRWQGSPLYTTMNNCILQVSQAAVSAKTERNVDVSEAAKRHWLPMIEHEQLEVGFGRDFNNMTNALFLPASITKQDSSKL